MITQKYQQGKHEIKIEVAESLQDAEKNKFPNGIYTRYFIDGKLVSNYFTMIKFIIEEIKTSGSALVGDENKLIEARNNMLLNQNNERRKNLENLKNQYIGMGANSQIINEIDKAIKKINDNGIRIS